MTIQGTSAKNTCYTNCTNLSVFSYTDDSYGGGSKHYMKKKHSMTDSARGAGGSRRISQSLIFCDIDFFGRHPLTVISITELVLLVQLHWIILVQNCTIQVQYIVLYKNLDLSDKLLHVLTHN